IASDEGNRDWIRWSSCGDVIEVVSDLVELRQALVRYGFGPGSANSIKKNFNEYRFSKFSDGRKPVPDQDGVVWTKWSHCHFHRDHPEW
ncbi:hypothetical protein GGI24_004330, partial [Coemansia furcata]